METSGKVIPAERPGLFLNDLLEKKNFSDFRKAFSLNDRFRFRRELFGGDEARMNKVINDLNDLHSYEDSVTYLNNELKWNIEWFNPTTREIRFRDLEPAKAFVPYREIVFRLDDETLFAAATIVSDVNSQIYYDLVLYLSDPVEPRCYLNDAYPLWAADSDEARANAEARAEGWNKFLEHLRQDGRLQE